MTRSQASMVASYLNRIYTGPLEGIFSGCAAFSDHRTSMVDFDSNWVYLVYSPNGAFLDGRELTFKEIHDAITDAMVFLCIPGASSYPFIRCA